jgi:hypothetical protein
MIDEPVKTNLDGAEIRYLINPILPFTKTRVTLPQIFSLIAANSVFLMFRPLPSCKFYTVGIIAACLSMSQAFVGIKTRHCPYEQWYYTIPAIRVCRRRCPGLSGCGDEVRGWQSKSVNSIFHDSFENMIASAMPIV